MVAAILWLTLAPKPIPDNDMHLFPGADKVVHALMFGVLNAVLIFDFRRRRPREGHVVTCKEVVIITIVSTIFAALDEWAQGAMALGRTAELLDFAADFMGILLAALLLPPLLNRHYTR